MQLNCIPDLTPCCKLKGISRYFGAISAVLFLRVSFLYVLFFTLFSNYTSPPPIVDPCLNEILLLEQGQYIYYIIKGAPIRMCANTYTNFVYGFAQCTLDRFTKTFFWNFESIRAD